MASMNTRLNVEKVDVNIVQKHGGSKQVEFKQLGPGVETGVHGVHDEKYVWFEVELQGRDREAEVFQSKFAKHLGVAGIHQQNGLVDETNMTLFAKVVLYRNMSFSENGKYKKTFMGSGVGTGSMQVLHGFEFEVEPLRDHTFEREQHLACELFRYREDTNEAAFAVVAVEKIYANESLTFNNTVVYGMVFPYGCKAKIWVTKDLLVKAKGNILGLEIIRDQSG
nr:zinc finger, CCHC-type [Tanacetum cinerariifolium]